MMDISDHEGCTANITIEIASVAHFNGKPFLKMICVVNRKNMNNTLDDKNTKDADAAKKELEEIQNDIIYDLKKKIIESKTFKDLQKRRLDRMWKAWNKLRSPPVKLIRKKTKKSAKTVTFNKYDDVTELTFHNMKEYEAWKEKTHPGRRG